MNKTDIEMKNGAIWLKGEFAFSQIQNHYPSVGVPQSFSAVLHIKGEADTHDKYNTQLSEAHIVFREFDTLMPPTINQTVLHLPQPIAAYPMWEFILTKAKSESHYIAFTIDGATADGKTASWAFVHSTDDSFVSIGP